MKKTLVIIFIWSAIMFSQEQKFFDAPFGGGGGYVPSWHIPNLDPVNVQLKALGIPELSNSGFYGSGGAGFIYIGVVPFLRVGGMGYSGSVTEEALVDNNNHEITYSLGGGGLTVEYTLPFIKNFGVSIGAVLGAGSSKIEIFRNSGPFSWNGIWDELSADSSSNLHRTLKNSFWLISPTLNIDIPVYRFVTFRIGGGYQLTLGNDWTIDNEMDINNVPSDLTGNAFFIQSGIFIGFFSF